MINSVYREDENYFPKAFLEIYNFNCDIEYCNEKKIERNKCIDLCLEKAGKLISSHPKTQGNLFKEI